MRYLILLLLLLTVNLYAQEENSRVVVEGFHYLDLKIKAADKYNSHLEKEQQQLLKKLKKREQKLSNKLKRTDSAAYARFRQQNLSYDSISKMMNADSATMAARTKGQKNPIMDSLKGVEAFVQGKSANPNSPQLQQYTSELNKEQAELNYHTYINNLITQRTNALKSMAAQGDIPGFTGMEKEVYYARSRMNVYKDMEEDPSKAEDRALEYLEGSEGFDNAMKGQSGSIQGMTSGASSSDLEKMGYQTKNQLQQNLQQKFGSGLGSVAQNVNSQITQYQDQLNGIKSSINDAKQTKRSLAQLKNTSKPSFKVNPMRGLPLFWKRFEKQYNWQMTRAAATGQPALLDASAMIGFKHTPKLVYGAGIASSIGLGQSWSNIHFSFQGIGLRTYATWQWQYGIGTYLGYERMYKQAVFIKQPETTGTDVLPSTHNTSTYSESLLVGLTKSYRINSKYNGAIQILYDVWWQQKGMSSPILIRIATIK